MIYEKRSEIIELVELDQCIAQHSQELKELEDKGALLIDEKEQVAAEVEAADKLVHDLKVKIDGLELELKSLEQKQERIKEKMLSVKSQKELESLEHEQESIVMQREELDEQGLALLLDYDKAKKEAAYKTAELPKKEQVIQQELDEVEDRSAHLKKLINAYTDQRTSLAARVPGDFLETYDTMRERVPNPVVPIIKKACSGCFSELRSVEIAQGRAGEFVPCQACYRLMYLFTLEKNDEY